MGVNLDEFEIVLDARLIEVKKQEHNLFMELEKFDWFLLHIKLWL